MTAWWLDDGDPGVGDGAPQVADARHAVAQVVLVHDLFEPHRDGVEVTPRQAAVGGEPLGEDQQVLLLLGQSGVVGGQQPADVGEAVLLRGERAAVGEAEDLADDVGDVALRLALLA
ncbi:MAG TPA: hypothetical protein VMM12_18645 [Longimicrobiales bacterium]|nr:hypothetical protein [Longimicrobiales bacterium]